VRDIPAEWKGLDVTVDVEAKAKERAVVAVMGAVSRMDARKPRGSSRPGGAAATDQPANRVDAR
jgi:hypothetical protein